VPGEGAGIGVHGIHFEARCMSGEILRRLPQVERLLQSPEIEALGAAQPRGELVGAVRRVLDNLRSRILGGELAAGELERESSPSAIAAQVRAELRRRDQSIYRRVINGTGIILHTGLGRAVLGADALNAIAENLRGASVVEFDLETGLRNEREAPLRALLGELTGAESATVVNNNAAATLVILATLARGREVVVSRGQLVEIGGSFRIPEILAESGARLVEVGTTNRTYIRDYERAITAETALLLDVHTSNYEIRGFTHRPSLVELVALGRSRGLAVASDLGSGCFVDVRPFGFRPEPLVRDVVAARPDLVCFSGDKLLGGPQAGIIVGTRGAIERIRSHPLFRCLRVDKTTLTLLEATLRAYRDPDRIVEAIPALRALASPLCEVRARVERFISVHSGHLPSIYRWELTSTSAEMGSGTLPAQEIPSAALAISSTEVDPDEIARRLRVGDPPVVPRLHGGRTLIDFRTVLPSDEDALAVALSRLH
jgi:L-seryl-tRNA(Ser) seleniumtransferase